MFKYILQRLLQLVFVIWSVGTLTFVLTRSLPGDMAYRIAASRYGYDQTDAAAAAIVRAELGLDQPWWQSYTDWLLDLVQLNLGHSLVSGEAIWAEISHQFGHTLALALVALVLSLLIGPPLGLLAAQKPNGLFDRFTLVISTMLRSVPSIYHWYCAHYVTRGADKMATSGRIWHAATLYSACVDLSDWTGSGFYPRQSSCHGTSTNV